MSFFLEKNHALIVLCNIAWYDVGLLKKELKGFKLGQTKVSGVLISKRDKLIIQILEKSHFPKAVKSNCSVKVSVGNWYQII